VTRFSTKPGAPAPESVFPPSPARARVVANLGIATSALHPPRRVGHDLLRPLAGSIVQSTSYAQSGLGSYEGPTYSRVANPSVDELETLLGSLENALPSVTFSTGLGAETGLFLALLKAGDHAVVGDAIYGGTTRLFRQILSGLGISFTFVDSSNPAAVEAAIRNNTKLVFIESPANPTLKLTDIAAIAGITNPRSIPLAVDNTFLTPVLQHPLELGADVSVYSTTKHIEGHSAALGGALTTRNAGIADRLRFIRKATGGIQTPFNAWVTVRGIKTLALRIREQSRHAATVAAWLDQSGLAAHVIYPGLTNFPQRGLAERQHLGGHGGVVTFELNGGYDAAVSLLSNLTLGTLAEHIGGVETLFTHPASMTHGDVPREDRLAVGLTDGLIRLSVGLEDPIDIIRDFADAAAAAGLQPVSSNSAVSRTGQKGSKLCRAVN